MIILYKIAYIILSYLLGSILFSEIFVRLFRRQSLFIVSPNHNPGASNAFKYGGVFCGIASVIGDVGKGMLPVFFYNRLFGINDMGIAMVMAAVALGHAFPIFFHFHGGMCIAVSFGALLGLWPMYYPLLFLIILYLAGLAVHRHGNSLITIFVFSCLSIMSLFLLTIHLIDFSTTLGIFAISIIVCVRIWPDVDETEQEQVHDFVNKLRSNDGAD